MQMTHSTPVLSMMPDVHPAGYSIETSILEHIDVIEDWFSEQWTTICPVLTCSVDIRHAGFKMSPVDTNLFPAGFNNLSVQSVEGCVKAINATCKRYGVKGKDVLVIPERHTRNIFYGQSLKVLEHIWKEAGYTVHIGTVGEALDMPISEQDHMHIPSISIQNGNILVGNVMPDFILLNNDMSDGIPSIFSEVKQPIFPSPQLGWASRQKTTHFEYYHQVATAFCSHIGIDVWWIDPYFMAVDKVDFMEQIGLDALCEAVDKVLRNIREKYQTYAIPYDPFVTVKADSGTYGMGVMMVKDAETLRALNRKQRVRMASSKGGQDIHRVMVQEGVYTFEAMPDGAAAEPVVYLIGSCVVGGFYRIHKDKGVDDNLNAKGMYFEPLQFATDCNSPHRDLPPSECNNRLYTYGVIARLAALAAAKEAAEVTQCV